MHTLWQRIKNPESYQQELEGIVRAITGERARSPLDQAPTPAATAPSLRVPDVQTMVLRVAGEMALEADARHVDPYVALQVLEDRGVALQEAWEQLDSRLG